MSNTYSTHKRLGVGIIGTGSIAGSCHAPAVKAMDQTSLVAVLSRNKATGQDFLQRHGVGSGTVHTTLESFATDPGIDLAIICSPDRLHAEQFGPYQRIELFGEKGHAMCENTMGREGTGEVRINDAPIEFEATSPFIGQLQNVLRVSSHTSSRVQMGRWLAKR